MSFEIEYGAGNEGLSLRDKQRAKAYCIEPGQTVTVKASGEASVVDAVVVVDEFMFYRLRGEADLVPSNKVRDARRSWEGFGIILQRDEDIWLQPLDAFGHATAVDEPYKMAATLEKGAQFMLALSDLKAWLDQGEDGEVGPVVGDFYLVEVEPGVHALAGLAWSGLADDQQIAAASEALDRRLGGGPRV